MSVLVAGEGIFHFQIAESSKQYVLGPLTTIDKSKAKVMVTQSALLIARRRFFVFEDVSLVDCFLWILSEQSADLSRRCINRLGRASSIVLRDGKHPSLASRWSVGVVRNEWYLKHLHSSRVDLLRVSVLSLYDRKRMRTNIFISLPPW